VISPTPLSRVEQGYLCICFRIDACSEVVASFVAAAAGKGKIIEVICSSQRLGLEMVDG
jgi:hypothetical protein